MMIKNEREMVKHINKILEKAGTREFCKKCAEDGHSCCARMRCGFNPETCWDDKMLGCALAMCNRLQLHFPRVHEQIEKIKKKLKYKQVLLPVKL